MWCFTNWHRCGSFTCQSLWQRKAGSFCILIVDQDRTQVCTDWLGGIVHDVGWGGGGNGSMFFPLWEAVYAHYKPLPLTAIFHPQKGVPGSFLLWNHDFFYKEKYVCLVPVFNSNILQDLWQYYILKKVWHILFFLRLSFASLQPG